MIPDEAVIKLNVRTFDEGVRSHVLEAIKRIVEAEAQASGAPRRAGDHAARPLPARPQRSRRRSARARRRFRDALRRRTGRRDPADLGERGLRLLRQRVARAVDVLDGRRHRPRDLPRRRRRRGGWRSCRPTTTRASRRCSTRRSRPAWRRWSRPRRAWLARVASMPRRAARASTRRCCSSSTWRERSCSGSAAGLAGVRARLDLFGVVVLAVVVGLAGGITRDLLIGIPPQTFRDWRYLAVAGGAGLVTFVAHPRLARLERPILILDAAGLALFCVTGASTALDHRRRRRRGGRARRDHRASAAASSATSSCARSPSCSATGLYAIPALDRRRDRRRRGAEPARTASRSRSSAPPSASPSASPASTSTSTSPGRARRRTDVHIQRAPGSRWLMSRPCGDRARGRAGAGAAR